MTLSKFLDPKVAREMLVDKMDINTIAKFTGLSISEIEKLQEAITLE
ncbi:MAG: hypothetical protein LJD31_01960 [Wolbachia endosymbiont of Menacanthus eurysternus]|nr:hypothetical protein [Wolbachia endosymbiont of Menacanthus eurysternus]